MAFDIQDYETFGLLEEEEERRYKSFFIISLFTFLVSAFIGFYFADRPLFLWKQDGPWFHFIPLSITAIWTGIVFLSVSPVRKAFDILLSGFLAVFVWYKIFSSF